MKYIDAFLGCKIKINTYYYHFKHTLFLLEFVKKIIYDKIIKLIVITLRQQDEPKN
jgi:hypothetical protein